MSQIWVSGQQLYYQLNRSVHQVRKHMDGVFVNQLDVTTVQVAALLYIAEHDGCTLRMLGDGLGLNNSAITGLIGRMKKKGLITRQNHPTDRRSTCIGLSPKGSQIATDAQPLVNEANRKIEENFSADEIAIVNRFLNQLVEKFE